PPTPDENQPFQPNVLPDLAVPRISTPIQVDGALDDPGWQEAARATNFTEYFPGDRTQPPIEMETLVSYDDTHLYLAFLVKDDPQTVRATLSDRDQMWSDDYVGILLDTYGDANWAYFIFANPLGIQGDSRFVSGTGEDDGIDLLYASDGMITNDGYQVEMAIPFSSLRFPKADVQSWKATFWITHPRGSRSQYSWAAIDRDDACWLCQWGTLSGIQGVEAARNFELLPSLVGSQVGGLADSDDPASAFETGDFGSDVGLGIKYMITPNLVADVALNPDFSQVEADAAQIDVNETFALFFPERRPFFQEGGDLFRTYKQVVYSRTINDPSVAAKLTGRFDKLSLAYMGGRDENTAIILPFEERSATLATALKSTTNILRAKQSFGENSSIGALLTDRRLDGGGSGTLLSADLRYQFHKNYRLETQLMASLTQEPDDTALTAEEDLEELRFGAEDYTAVFDGETFQGSGAYVSLERDAKHYSFDIDYYFRSPTFRADNGFITSNNSQFVGVWQGYNFYFTDNKFVDRVLPALWVERTQNYDGTLKRQWINPWIDLSLKAQTSVWLSYNIGRETFGDRRQEFTGIQRLQMNVNSQFSEPVQLGFYVESGQRVNRDRDNPVLGRGYVFSVWGTLKPTQRLVIQPDWDYSELSYPDDPREFPAGFDETDGTPEELAGGRIFQAYVFRTRLNYQFTKELFLRVIVQYNHSSDASGNTDDAFDIDPLITYRINPFSAVYIGSALDYLDYGSTTGITATNRTYFFKLQYLFNI
ncbi:MAG: DUF5916 domain-containing protein, partial [Candidatus Neomarinimicrobiota bacterium]